MIWNILKMLLTSCFEFWWFELMVINVVFKFGPVELMVGL